MAFLVDYAVGYAFNRAFGSGHCLIGLNVPVFTRRCIIRKALENILAKELPVHRQNGLLEEYLP